MAASPRVDVHHHFYPPEYFELLRGGTGVAGANLAGIGQWTPAATLEEMDRNGVTTAILSLSPPGPRGADPAAARRLARICNEYGARMCRNHPGRFGLFAPVPMPDIDGTLIEIEYALDVLGADGIELTTSYRDTWLGDPRFDPVMDELNRRKAAVFVHPLAPDCCAGLIDWVPASLIEFPHDTSRAILSLMFGGTLDRLPDIRFIFYHAGGTIPMLAGRIKQSGANRPFLAKVPKGIDHELKKLHYDIALAASRPSLLALFDYVPMSQILLGSDYPFASVGASLEGLEAMGLPPEQVQAIHAGNARRLLPRLSG
ncbi:MAG TPA: amidohydrolase family protein [Stellaceae bacterium]|nr:amidohydrolase family protein [Stellaceae bacterium]